MPGTASAAELRCVLPAVCPCGAVWRLRRCADRMGLGFNSRMSCKRGFGCKVHMIEAASGGPDFHSKSGDYAKGGLVDAQKLYVVKHLSEEEDGNELNEVDLASRFTGFQEDPMVDKLRSQLGPMHPIPTPPFNRNVAGLFVLFFMFGIVFDKLWTARKRSQVAAEARSGTWPQVPTSFSLFLEKDLKRKESVEWVNMVVGKLWKVYREGLENWIIGLLQPVIDDLKKPDYVERVEIKQFSLGEEPLSVRNVERKTSRRANDLQYQIGLRYTGDARALLSLKLKFGIIPVVVPVGIRDFDIDGELWVKLRLIPTEPWVGAVSWAFVTLPKIKFVLSPFRLFNLMGIPVLSMFLLKLLTEDLPRLFVRPKKIVLDFQKGKAHGPVPGHFNNETTQEGNRDFVGELSVTLVDARRLTHFFFAKTDPYVILSLGDQLIRSKKNSQTTVIGPPGEPIWNQDFHMLVADPKNQKLSVQVKDSIGFTYFTVGAAEVDLGSLQDTVPTDKVVVLQGGWTPFGRGISGEILLRLTYKAYVEDEEDSIRRESVDRYVFDDEMSNSEEMNSFYPQNASASTPERERDSFMDVLTALLVSEEFQGIVDFETTGTKNKSSMKSPTLMSESQDKNGEKTAESSGESVLLWLAAITSVTILISINIGGASLFNP